MLNAPQSVLEYFFIFKDIPKNIEVGTYIPFLVVLSFVIAALGSFAGLRLATNIHLAQSDKTKNFLHLSGALAFGAGIWSMHFIGMLAYNMAMKHSYDSFLTALSMVIAVIIAYGVLQIVRSGVLGTRQLITSSVLLGAAICGMHYTGMAAMEMDADLRYRPLLFSLSVGIAIVASGAALWIFFILGQHAGKWKLFWQIMAALVMGAAICGMHYTGMAAAVFIPYADCRYDPDQDFMVLALTVAITSAVIFAAAMILSFYNKPPDMAGKESNSAYAGHSVFLQLSLLLSVFLILLIGSYVFLSNNLHHQKNNQSLLGAASIQRMLIVRYAIRTSIIVSSQAAHNWEEVIEHNVGMQNDKKYIETNYRALINGGKVVLSVDDQQALGTDIQVVSPVKDDQIKDKLLFAEQHWETLKNLGTTVLQSDVKNVTDDPRYEEFEDQLFDTVNAQDAAVKALLGQVQKQNHALILKQGVILGIGILTFLLTLLHARFFIAKRIDNARRELEEHQNNLEFLVYEQTKDLVKSKEVAEKANVAKSEFLANMSHELRTPLNSILGLSKMLVEDTGEQPEEQDMALTVHKSASYLLDIVNDILDLSKIEAGEIILESIGFDFKKTVASVIETLAPLASSKGVSLTCSYKHNHFPYVLGDPVRISRILTNLIGNAIKYTDKGSVQTIIDYESPVDNKLFVSCSVIDTGIGIPENKLNVVFEKFSQADESTTRKYGGTGLGLAITKELIEMMGGEIGVTSEVNKGSKFWFSITFEITDALHEDLQIKSENIDIESIDESKKIPAYNARILVAEDHDLNQIFIKKLLNRLGFYYYDIAENGQMALEAYKDRDYDLILMDCHMPEKNGYEVTSEIRKLEKKTGKHIPIVALTADAMAGTREKCLKAGMDHYITKPINSKEMKQLLEIWFSIPDDDQAKKVEEKIAAPVNIELLKEYADTPEDLENFINIFIRQTDQCLKELEPFCTDGECKTWVEMAHKLKGGAGMIGAKKLHLLCSQAQEMANVSSTERKIILTKIGVEYRRVKEYLENREG